MARHLPNRYKRQIKQKKTIQLVKIAENLTTSAIVTKADEYGRVCLLAQKQDSIGASIKSNAAVIAAKIIYQPPFLPPEDADYLARNLQPKIDDRHTPIY